MLYTLTSHSLGTPLEYQGWAPNCINSWFGVGNIPQRSYRYDSITELLQMCRLHMCGANLSFHNIPKERLLTWDLAPVSLWLHDRSEDEHTLVIKGLTWSAPIMTSLPAAIAVVRQRGPMLSCALNQFFILPSKICTGIVFLSSTVQSWWANV